jgi:hypothetical protein
MKSFNRFLAVSVAILALCMFLSSSTVLAQQTAATKPAPAKAPATKEISDQELSSTMPALGELHKVIRPLWHEAYPAKDYAKIKSLLPQADTLVAAVDKAALPGILRDKQAAWDVAKGNLKNSLAQLHVAAKADNQEEMLKQTEAFHAAFEGCVRTIRPAVPELDAFHQELYKLYHYYTPAYDLEKIRTSAAAMTEKVAALKTAKLPERLADREEKFRADVAKLEAAVNELNATVKTDVKEKVKAAVEKVHAAYQETEKTFD